MPAAKTTALAPELEQIRGILEGWRTNNLDHLHLRNELASIVELLATPAIYDRARGSLTCPLCGFLGLDDGEPQHGKHGKGFRYVEDIMEFRDIRQIDAGETGAEKKYDLLQCERDTEHNLEDTGRFARLECRNCLGECALPEGLEIDFV